MKRTSFLFAMLMVAAVESPAATPPPEKLLPNDTLGMFTVPDYSSAKKVWDQWPSSQLWHDPAIKAFKDKFLAKLRTDVVEPLEKEFGLKVDDYRGLAQGQITYALTRSGWNGQSDARPGFLLLIDTRDKSDALKANLASLKKKWVDNGKQIKTDTIRGLEFTTLIFSSDDFSKTLDKIFPDPNEGWETVGPQKKKKTPRKLEWLVGQSGPLLILGSSAQDIEKVLIRQAGGDAPPLADVPAFAAQHGRQFREANCYLWVDLKTLISIGAKPPPQEGQPSRRGPGMSADKILSTLGLTGLQALSFTEKDSPEGPVFALQVKVPEGERKGLLKILTLEAKDASPPPFVPADAVKFSRTRLDLAKGINTLEAMLVEAFPQMAGVIKLVVDNAGKDKDPNFDMRQQLFANLGDDVVSYEKVPRKQTLADLNSPPSLLLISSPKPQEMAAAMRSLSALAPQQTSKVKEREFLGRKVYSMPLPPMPGQAGAPTERTLHFAASGDYVAMSTEVAMLEEYLRSNASGARPLRETAGLADAAEKIGGLNTGMFGFENQRETARVLIETLKKESGTLASLFSSSPIAGRLGLNENPNALKDWLDFSLLPPFDRIAKYFHFTVWSGSLDAEGLNFRLFGPMPPQLRK